MFDIMDLEDEERNKLLRLDDSQMQVRECNKYFHVQLVAVCYFIAVRSFVSVCLSNIVSDFLTECRAVSV